MIFLGVSQAIGRGRLTTLKISLSLSFPSNYFRKLSLKTDSQLYKNYLCIQKNASAIAASAIAGCFFKPFFDIN